MEGKNREIQGHRILKVECLRPVSVLGDRGRVKGALPWAVMDRLGFDRGVGLHLSWAFKAGNPGLGTALNARLGSLVCVHPSDSEA